MRFFLFYIALISCALAQTPRITEILPVNTTGIQDENQSFQGWVEIWNPLQASTSAPFGVFTLTNYKLSNGTTTWAFPAGTALQMMPDERLIVWVSGKNRAVVTAPLHTNFTLPAGGGVVQLLNAANAVVSQITYPAMAANESFGRDEWDVAPIPTQVGTYNTPTPGDRNNFTGPSVAGKVVFSITSRAYSTAQITITLSQANPDPLAEIRYTADRSVPTATTGTKYTVPLTFGGTAMIRARVFKPGLLPGETETNCYLQVDQTTSGFSSPMPIMVVTSFGVAIPNDGDLGGFAWMWEPAPPDNRARFTNTPTFASRIAMDKRGSSTLGNAKYNTNFEVRKGRDDDDRDVSFLGMADGSDFVLSGPFDFDRSEVHNPFIFSLSRSIGRYAPDARFMEVFFDVTGGQLNAPNSSTNDYYGIYNFMEKIRRDKNRVNVTNLRPYDNDAVGKTGGYVYKVDRQDTGDTGFGAGNQTMAYYDPKEIEAKSPQRDPQEQYLTSYINSFNNALQGGNFRDPVLGYAPFLDVPAAIDHHLLNVWTTNVDAFRLSGYWHKERGGKLVPGPIWDFDRALESTDGRDDNPAVWRGTGDATDFFNYTWWNRLFFDPDFYQKYIDRWQDLRRGGFSQATVNALLDSLNSKMPAESINRDLGRWNMSKRTGTFPGSPSPSYDGTQAGEIKRIKEWLQVRANFMDSQWVGPVTASLPEGNVAVGTQVSLTGPVGGTIYYTLDGADPRPSGGGPPSGVLTYSGPITINATTRVKARAYNAAKTALTGANNPPLVSKWGGIIDVRYATEPPATPSSIVVTEVNYHPVDASPAELAINPVFADSDFEFIEIKNLSAGPVDLGGVKISFATDFTFSGSNAITLAPGAFAIVAANPAAFTARYGAKPNLVGPFPGDLDNGGEEIELRSAPSAGNAVILDFSFNDTWYPATDGQGRSLAVYNPGASPAAFGNALNWRASAAMGGSPGADEPNLAPTLTPGSTIAGYLPSLVINATVTDDTQPSNTVTVGWSKLGGPGPVDFAPADASATQASFELPGTYSLRLSASDTALTAQSDFTIQMRDTPGAWMLRHPGIGTLNDDPDGDGRTNFFEWALSLSPLSGAGGDGSIVVAENDHLTLTYTRQKASPFVSYKVQVTSNPGAWADPQVGDITETILADDGVTQTVKATDNTLMSSQAARFIRLRVAPLP